MSVIPFPERKPPQHMVFQCHCGCQLMWLHEDGVVQCPRCECFLDHVRGAFSLREPPEATTIEEIAENDLDRPEPEFDHAPDARQMLAGYIPGQVR